MIGSRLSTDGTNSLLMNKPVLTGIFELFFGIDNSTRLAMIRLTRRSGVNLILWSAKLIVVYEVEIR